MRVRDAVCGLAATTVSALLCGPTAAQVSVTDAEIDRAVRSTPRITEQDLDAARRLHRMPTDAELARVPVPSAPTIDALPQAAARPGIDLESIARGYQAIQRGETGAVVPSNDPRLLAFVSFSMPEATLMRLAEQASVAGATLVLRGLVDGSMRQTVAKAQRLVGSRQVAFQIDPLAFDRFGVSVVPAFVLLRRGAEPRSCDAGSCFAADAFAMTAGDVSIRYALEFISRAAPAFAGEAAILLRRVKE